MANFLYSCFYLLFQGAEAAASENSLVQAIDLHQLLSISISMPSSPAMLPLDQYKRVLFSDANNWTRNLPANSSHPNTKQPKQLKFHSHPIPVGAAFAKAVAEVTQPWICDDKIDQNSS